MVRAVGSSARELLAAPVSEPVAAGGTAEPTGFGERGAVGGASAETVGLPDVVGPSAAQGSRARGPRPLPGADGSGRPSPAVAKATGRRKLALAGGLLTRHTTEPPVPDEAVPPAPATDFPSTATETGPGTNTFPHPMPSAPLTGATTAAPHLAPPEPAPHTGATPCLTPSAPLTGATTAAPHAAPHTTAADTRATPDQAAPPLTTETDTLPHPASSAPLIPATPYPAPPAPSLHPGAAPAPAVPGGAQVHGPVIPLTATASPPPESPRARRAAKAVAFARAQVGKPCVSGATGPGSYDGAGLTQAAWRAAGVALPRAAHAQALAGTPVTADAMEPGDLVVFFDDDRHVGLHTGGGMMVHAPGPGSVIREEPVYGAGETAIRRVVRPA
ncbi:C40 family peptidase [Streptomyces sp. SCL15-4]|uniref:C40 family peptidase n=1 Tax=Streptomyces sp. SCL15-4 TaxID=2967221 RepID=UPI002966EF57|nr:NlpC/P60 family protein [Streptomyces sp. SCL15-4]